MRDRRAHTASCSHSVTESQNHRITESQSHKGTKAQSSDLRFLCASAALCEIVPSRSQGSRHSLRLLPPGLENQSGRAGQRLASTFGDRNANSTASGAWQVLAPSALSYGTARSANRQAPRRCLTGTTARGQGSRYPRIETCLSSRSRSRNRQ
jgi:hypothetical protein